MILYSIEFTTYTKGNGIANVVARNVNEAIAVLRGSGKLNATPDEYLLTNATVISQHTIINIPTLLGEKFTDSVYYKGDKGDKGDPLKWDDLTEEEKAEFGGVVIEDSGDGNLIIRKSIQA